MIAFLVAAYYFYAGLLFASCTAICYEGPRSRLSRLPVFLIQWAAWPITETAGIVIGFYAAWRRTRQG